MPSTTLPVNLSSLMWRLFCYGAVGLLFTATGGCLEGPARSNPFDARSDAFVAIGGVSGRVLDGAQQPLPNAAVRLGALPDGTASDTELILATRTGADGRFRFDDVPADRYLLDVAWEPVGATLRDTVSVETGRMLDLQTLVLNAPPVFSDIASAAVHLRQWSVEPGHVYLLEVPALGFAEALPERQPGRYAAVLEETQLPGEALHALVGLEMRLKARDEAGATSQTAPLVIERVIDEVPVPSSPTDFVQITNVRPTFRWETFRRPYPFTFVVGVTRVQDELEVPVWEQTGISPSATSLQMSDTLAPGTYVWTVAAVDAFGNRGRSAQAGFRVVEEQD